jgi:hypothetical protein
MEIKKKKIKKKKSKSKTRAHTHATADRMWDDSESRLGRLEPAVVRSGPTVPIGGCAPASRAGPAAS